MTDTGQVPGEGLPENQGMVEQPGVPAPGAYTYLSDTTAEDEDLLLLPGAQGAWGNEVAPPAPAPVVETVHEPGPHETAGRDSGSVDLSAVRMSSPAPQPPVARRPLHLGPPTPDGAGSPVRSFADRGPAGAPVHAVPVRQAGPPTVGPEYLDVPRDEIALQGAAPWGAQAQVQVAPPVAQVGAEATGAETVFPEGGGAHAGGTPDDGPAPVAEAAHVPDAGGVPLAGGEGVPAAQSPAEAPAPEPAQAEQAQQVHPDPSGAAEVAEAGPAPVQAAADAPEAEPAPEAVPAPDPAYVPQQPEAGQAPEGMQVPEAVQVPEVVQAPEAVAQAPEAVQVQDYAQAPLLADGSLFPQAPETPQTHEVAQTAPEFAPAPDLAQFPQPTPFPVAPVAAYASQQSDDTGSHTPEAYQPPQAPDEVQPAHAEPDPQAAYAAEQQFLQDPAAAQFAEAGPQSEIPQQQPQSAEPAPVVHEAAQAQEAVQTPQFAESAEAPVVSVADVDHSQAAPVDMAAQPETPEPVAVPDQVAAPEPVVVHGDPTYGDPSHNAPPQGHEPHGHEPHDEAAVPTAAPVEVAHAEESVGQFVQVEGTIPTTPHLAPTPPHAMTVPPFPEELAEQPAEETAAPVEATAEQPVTTEQLVATEQATPVEQPAPAPESVPEAAPAEEPALALPTPREPEPAPEAEATPVPEAPVEDPDQDAEPVAAQHAEDLDTRAADQEESTAAVAETREPAGPAAPGYDDAEREAVLRVMRERRDIRNGFRSDPIPHDVLLRVLEAAHTAPSVGHSQPWDFVVIRSAETRRTMHELAQRQREAYAKSLPKGRAKQFKELKIEAILDTPVNIVVTADSTRGGRHTLGRHTQPQMAPYSSALAVENLWLAARAEGLGVGWVSFFDEREMVRELGLPEHLDVVAYLCVGYVDEFPEEPELLQAGWSKRRPLSWVVHEETYGRRALPGEEPHDLLAETVSNIRPLDAKALGEAWERQKRMTKPAGALGMLEIISAQLSGLSRMCPPPIPEPAAVAIFAGDHGVHAQGVTPWPQEVTGQMVANILGGGAVCNAFANQVGAEVCVVDVGVASDLPATPGLLPRKVRAGTADMTTGSALTREEVKAAIEVGIETARDLVAAGNKALITGEMGIANTTASAALISVFTDSDPADVTGRGTGINDETLARKTEVVRRALDLHQPDPADPIGVLAAIGGLEHAAMVGLLLGGASLRTPVILDGVSAGAAALVARAIAPEVLAACIAGHRSAEPGHVAALNKLGLRPLVDLDLRLGEGTGALLALPVVQSAARAMHEVATFDSAGVTEK
ncbi:nicotinate-nucleotide--dimethylbenzimidazole phosphoribosyltransferase [Streptomyces sp. ActVer]|uniref:nicotinate-nucleotide--dimethylbenzimidazole phosphoribosyltransferase n=1 Tax=Streptomyces sp. ActVer TaxID=3014558 RepID=UPI0022B322D5|nr:nicotinate-nucleotide--dimethylbenzimidazole phosphoribosyltransferase [Streptomyces sp. ActVer]MCZ4513429.1 nicotinate-nucleotide--dimethylbenzimidazole phosphoribosyltransferase [Streptomyces sp. ActVer]